MLCLSATDDEAQASGFDLNSHPMLCVHDLANGVIFDVTKFGLVFVSEWMITLVLLPKVSRKNVAKDILWVISSIILELMSLNLLESK